MGERQTLDEFWALPIVEQREGYLGLAVMKTEGSVFAAQDDAGQWGVHDSTDDGKPARRRYPCRPW
jgi:hypothetical protein